MFQALKSRKDLISVTLICFSILLVFFELFTLDKAFLGGDHREQQYPWAKFYQQEVRAFRLPWWTTHIHCGFPLLAEGQIGAFYPLNFLFLLLLPIKWAYNYEILFQFLLGGLLFYAYLRRHRLSEWSSFFASLIYLYGSTQGGYFYYNLISQRVVIWLPLTLILIDRMREKGTFASSFFLALVFAVQIFGGYLQVAIYSIAYSTLYFLYHWWRSKSARFMALFAASGLLALVFSLPQLLPTYELSLLSSRAGAVRGLAYVGSMTPLGFATLFYPAWDGFLGSELYVGLLGFFFVLVGLLSRKGSNEKFFLMATCLFLLLALGGYSPLYRAIVEGTGFHAFRTPTKFLFFAAFSGAVLAAFGFEKFFLAKQAGKDESFPFLARARTLFLILGFVAFMVPPIGEFALPLLRTQGVSLLQDHVTRHIFGQAGHPYSLEVYLEKAAQFYEHVMRMASLSFAPTLFEWLLLGGIMIFLVLMSARKFPFVAAKPVLCMILFFDLYLYGWTSVKGNYEPFTSIDSPQSRSRMVEFLRTDRSLYRVMEVYQEGSENRLFPVFPNFNMLDGLDDIGAYSPLVMKEYKKFLTGWGYVNDSLAIPWVEPEEVLGHLKELSFLNVKYLLSAVPLRHPDLSALMEEKGVTLYRNEKVMPRAIFLRGKASLESFSDVEDADPVPIRSYTSQSVSIEFQAPSEGLLVLTDMAYPNWRLTVNGEPADDRRACGLFRGVPVKAGLNLVRFEYQPVLYQLLGMSALVVAFVMAFFILLRAFRSRAGRKRVPSGREEAVPHAEASWP